MAIEHVRLVGEEAEARLALDTKKAIDSAKRVLMKRHKMNEEDESEADKFWKHVARHNRKEYDSGKRYSNVNYYDNSKHLGTKTDILHRGKVQKTHYVRHGVNESEEFLSGEWLNETFHHKRFVSDIGLLEALEEASKIRTGPKYDKGADVRALARERVGMVPGRRVMIPKTRKAAKHKDDYMNESDNEAHSGPHDLPKGQSWARPHPCPNCRTTIQGRFVTLGPSSGKKAGKQVETYPSGPHCGYSDASKRKSKS